MTARPLLIAAAAAALTGCYAGSLRGDEGDRLRLMGGVMVVCETSENTLAAFGVAVSYEGCPHSLDTAADTSDTSETGDTSTTVIDTAADTASSTTTVDDGDDDTDGGICGFYRETLDTPGFCQPWMVQANSPSNAHTFNVWFEDLPARDDLTGAKAPEAILAHCPDPNGEIPTTATALTGSIEVTRDNGRKATVSMDTNRGTGRLKFQVCR